MHTNGTRLRTAGRRALPGLTGIALRRARLAADLTLGEVGAAIGVSAAAVCRWERGNRQMSGPVRAALRTILPTLER